LQDARRYKFGRCVLRIAVVRPKPSSISAKVASSRSRHSRQSHASYYHPATTFVVEQSLSIAIFGIQDRFVTPRNVTLMLITD
jgi:hypothetical protein